MSRTALLAMMVTLLPPALALPLTTAVAQESVAQTVNIEASLVRASRGEPAVDPALKAVSRDLRGLPYTTFTQLDRKRWKSTAAATSTAQLGKGVVVRTTVDAVTDDGVALTVEVLRDGKSLVRTAIKRPWGRAHVLSAGRDGDAALVIPIWVTR